MVLPPKSETEGVFGGHQGGGKAQIRLFFLLNLEDCNWWQMVSYAKIHTVPFFRFLGVPQPPIWWPSWIYIFDFYRNV